MEARPFEPIEPTPIAWPRLRDLETGGDGSKLLRRLLRADRATRSAVSRDLFFRLAGNFTPSLSIEVDGIRYHLNTRDREISRILFIYGLYDRPLMHAVFHVLDGLRGTRGFAGKKLLDVGANIGSTTLTACRYFGASGSHAFEPDPLNGRFLEINVRDNGLADSVRIHHAAVSDRAGTLQLELSDDNAGDHQIRVGGKASEGSIVDVPAVTLDELVAGGELPLSEVGAMWMDIQGHEGQAISGASEVLAAGVPLVLEYWPHGLKAAGGFDAVNDGLREHYSSLVDMGRPQEGARRFETLPIDALDRIAEEYGGADDHTDLLLLPAGLG